MAYSIIYVQWLALKCEVPRTFFLYPPTQIILILRWKLFFCCFVRKKISSTLNICVWSHFVCNFCHTSLHSHVVRSIFIWEFNYNREISFLFFISFRKLTFGFWYSYLLFVCPHAIAWTFCTQTCNLHIFIGKSTAGNLNYGLMDLWKSKDFAAN